MSRRFPRVRRHAEIGATVLREGVVVCVFIHRSHEGIAPAMLRALECYCRATGPEALGWYPDMNGDWQPLDDAGWALTRSKLLDPSGCTIKLAERCDGASGYLFEYHGARLDSEWQVHHPDEVSAASFWLPVEYLEEHGPGRVRELALELVRELPLSSGYVSLGFNALTELLGVLRAVREVCFHYPGMDVSTLSTTALSIGAKVRGAYWLNFYGQPLLGQLGGAESLRVRLSGEGITVEKMEGERVLVALGEWPEAGEEGRPMPQYRALARVLEPYLLDERFCSHQFPYEEMRRWLRRFLD